MTSYRFLNIRHFPEINSPPRETVTEGALPGFTRSPETRLIPRNHTHHDLELFEIEHEMLISEDGTAFGFLQGEPVSLEFHDYLKAYTVHCYVARDEGFLMLAAPSAITKDLSNVLEENSDLGTSVIEIELNLQELRHHVEDYLGAWFRRVSTRVSSSALFGSDLMHDPLFDRIIEDGGELSSVIIPVDGLRIQLNSKAGVSSQHRFERISDELALVRELKTTIIDRIAITRSAS